MEDIIRPRQELSHGKILVFCTALCILAFLLGLTTLEAYIRLTRPRIDLYVLTGRIPGPNPISKWASADAFSAYRAKPGQYAEGKTVNKYGFISTPKISVVKPKDTIRIVFLGGSSTAGTGSNLKDDETWPWQTVMRLRQKTSKSIDFINGALGGYSSFESYGRLWSKIRHFSPDIVVLYHGWNEMYYFNLVNNIVSWRTLPDGSWSCERRRPIAIYNMHWSDSLLRWSQLLTRVRLRLSRAVGGEVGTSKRKTLQTDFDRRGLDIWRTNLKLIRETCRVLGIKLFVAKQATLIVPELPANERKRCRYEFHGFDHVAHVAAFRGIYRVIDEEIPADSIIDVTVLSGRSDYLYDHIHPTPKGAKEIASIVSEALADYIEKEAKANKALQRTR
ncbi:MAG: SGNH/GDSL hydrolase family protein [Candidatus Hodarchaeota archaeon]